jgi:YbgC/YbaW family acyl-CoA thioester hydrolase
MVRNDMTEDRGPASIVVQRRIEWPDTDASGMWHNTAGFRFVEVAETALLERLGILDDVYGRLPRRRIDAEFKLALRFRDVLDVFIGVSRVGRSSIDYVFELRKGGEVAMTADVTAVLLDPETRAATEWPQTYRELLMKAGPQSPELLVVS